MMFQPEMENYALGLEPSELLFGDELLNIIPDGEEGNAGPFYGSDGDGGFIVVEPVTTKGFESVTTKLEDAAANIAKRETGEDLLKQVMEEVKIEEEEEEPVTEEPMDSSSLIEEMESFLTAHEGSLTNNAKAGTTDAAPEASEARPLTAEETSQAEELLDALMNGTISMDMDDSGYDSAANVSATSVAPTVPASLPQAVDAAALMTSGGINNISEIVTENGQKIVIVIANDDAIARASSPATSTVSAAASPAPSVTSDSDWTPDSPKATKSKASSKTSKREPVKRGPYKRIDKYKVKDKKERKKLQNVVAARRYRDKKKSEQVNVQQEQEELEAKNTELKANLEEVESELKTLKKLMVELGLVKVGKN